MASTFELSGYGLKMKSGASLAGTSWSVVQPSRSFEWLEALEQG